MTAGTDPQKGKYMDYIEEIMNIVKKALGEYEKINAELKRARAKLEAEELG